MSVPTDDDEDEDEKEEGLEPLEGQELFEKEEETLDPPQPIETNLGTQFNHVTKETRSLSSQNESSTNKTNLRFSRNASDLKAQQEKAQNDKEQEDQEEIKQQELTDSNTIQYNKKISDQLWFKITCRDASGNKLPFGIKGQLHPQYLSKLPPDKLQANVHFTNKDKYSFSDQDGYKLTIHRKNDGTLSLVAHNPAHTHEKGKGINSVELLMANVKRITDIMLEEKLEPLMKGTNALSREKAIEKIQKEDPDAFHFTIDKSAKASDIAYMLKTMADATPKITATLTEGALKQIIKAIDKPHKHFLNEDQVATLRQQLNDQQERAVKGKGPKM